MDTGVYLLAAWTVHNRPQSKRNSHDKRGMTRDFMAHVMIEM